MEKNTSHEAIFRIPIISLSWKGIYNYYWLQLTCDIFIYFLGEIKRENDMFKIIGN